MNISISSGVVVLRILMAGLLLVAAHGSWAGAMELGFEPQAGQRELFLDDVGISKVDNLKRTMHPPAKKGAVIRPTSPETSLQTRCAPQWDPSVKRFKLWMLTPGFPRWNYHSHIMRYRLTT